MKHAECRFQEKIYKLWNMGGGSFSVLVNYQALQLKYRSISPPPLQSFFSIKYRRYGLLPVSFIEAVALLGGILPFARPHWPSGQNAE